MTSSHIAGRLCHWFSALASALDARSAPRLACLLFGAILARGRRTVTSWIRGAGLGTEFRPCYTTVAAAGKRADGVAGRLVYEVVKPLLARLYVRKKDLGAIEAKHRPQFATKLELAVELVRWAKGWLDFVAAPVRVVADGAYAKAAFLKPLIGMGVVVVSRLRKDAALRGVPVARTGKRGRPRQYGAQRIVLAKRAGQKRGWTTGTFELYGKAVEKRYKTFEATWRPAGGVIRVVLVDEPKGWVAFFCTEPSATVADILGLVADRFSLEIDQAEYPPSRRWVCTGRIGYHRRGGVARTGRVVPATSRQPRRSRSMPDPHRRAPPPAPDVPIATGEQPAAGVGPPSRRPPEATPRTARSTPRPAPRGQRPQGGRS